MLKYNWNDMKKYTNNDINKILEYFTKVHYTSVDTYSFLLENRWARLIYNAGTETQNYIVNLEGLLRNRLRGTKEELFVYLELLSYRSSFSYHNTKGKVNYLSIWKAEHKYNIEKLKANRLLEIDEQNIHFIYEKEKEEWE